ncbi:hypothetical protein P7K49_020383 [Saguinus oedipus]|uniref:Uncharacterized protein n=1 Tax=Saguinus oedipus TaxID=9490 RepID=A0ABQ9V041_SAGOE|nr:hypothetical protein P7K49_020383 [Saguinus oedipus]
MEQEPDRAMGVLGRRSPAPGVLTKRKHFQKRHWDPTEGLIYLDLFKVIGLKIYITKKKSKPLNLKIHSSVGSCENIPSQQRSPLLCERSLRSFFVGHAPFLPSTPPVHTEANFSARVCEMLTDRASSILCLCPPPPSAYATHAHLDGFGGGA